MSARAIWLVSVAVVVVIVGAVVTGAVVVDRARSEVARAQQRVTSPEAEPPDLLRPDGLAEQLDQLLGGELPFSSDWPSGCLREGIGGLDVDDADADAQYADVVAAVEDVRGLSFERPVEPTYVTPSEMSSRVRRLVEAELDDELLELERRRLVAFGVLEPDVDYRELLLDLYAGQVAGYYDTDSRELVVATTDDDRLLDALDTSVLAHELTHALTDQVHGLDETAGLDDEAATLDGAVLLDSDRELAALAVIEGDATIVGTEVLFGVIDDPLDALSLLGADAGALPAGLPAPLLRELEFPYAGGARYVCGLLAAGGVEAVDAAYADPPPTTAAVLFDTDRTPQQPTSLPAPGESWRLLGTDTLGAARLSWLLEDDRGGEPGAGAGRDVVARVRGWDGDRLRVWADGPATAVSVVIADRAGDGVLCQSLRRWYDEAIVGDDTVPDPDAAADASRTLWDGGPQSAGLRCADDGVALAIAPSLTDVLAMLR